MQSKVYRDEPRWSSSTPPCPDTHTSQRRGVGRVGLFRSLHKGMCWGLAASQGDNEKVTSSRSSEPRSRAPVPEGFWAAKSVHASETRVTWCRLAMGEFVTEKWSCLLRATTQTRSSTTCRQSPAHLFFSASSSACLPLTLHSSKDRLTLSAHSLRDMAGAGEAP